MEIRSIYRAFNFNDLIRATISLNYESGWCSGDVDWY